MALHGSLVGVNGGFIGDTTRTGVEMLLDYFDNAPRQRYEIYVWHDILGRETGDIGEELGCEDIEVKHLGICGCLTAIPIYNSAQVQAELDQFNKDWKEICSESCTAETVKWYRRSHTVEAALRWIVGHILSLSDWYGHEIREDRKRMWEVHKTEQKQMAELYLNLPELRSKITAWLDQNESELAEQPARVS